MFLNFRTQSVRLRTQTLFVLRNGIFSVLDNFRVPTLKQLTLQTVALNFDLIKPLKQLVVFFLRQAQMIGILELELNVKLFVHELVADFVALLNVTRLGIFAIFFRQKFLATFQLGKLTHDPLRIFLPRRLVENVTVGFGRRRLRKFDDLHCLVELKAQTKFRRTQLVECFSVGMCRLNSFDVDYADAAGFLRCGSVDFFVDGFGAFGQSVIIQSAAD